MISESIRMFLAHRHQTIPHIPQVELPESFRGVPRLCSDGMTTHDRNAAASVCPLRAINPVDFSLDMGRCLFCGECANRFPDNIAFSNDWRMWAFNRKELVVRDNQKWTAPVCSSPHLRYKWALRMRQVCAGGDMGCELELGACSNVNFDMQRFGMEFTASPRHADAMVLTGPITANMASAVEDTWQSIPDPKLLIAVGTDAISGGLFTNERSDSIDRSFINKRYTPNLYVAGSPIHPLTFISAVAALTGRTL